MSRYVLIGYAYPSKNNDKIENTKIFLNELSKCKIEPYVDWMFCKPYIHSKINSSKETYELVKLDPNKNKIISPLAKIIYEIGIRKRVDGRVYCTGDSLNCNFDNLTYIEPGTFPAPPPYPKDWKAKIRKPKISPTGKLIHRSLVRFTKGGKLMRQIQLSRYIYETKVLKTSFLPHDVEIDHIDGNPLNNDVSNLRPISHTENKVKMFFNRENTNTFGTRMYVLRCPVCGNPFIRNSGYPLIFHNDGYAFTCSIQCGKRKSEYGKIPFKDQIIKTYMEYNPIDSDLLEIGPKGFVNALKVIPETKAIPVFSTIMDYIIDDDWFNAFKIIYKDRLNRGLTSDEDPDLLNKVRNLLNNEKGVTEMSKKNVVYDESTIESFDSIGIIRQRPTVYIHAIGQKGVFKMVLEALDNSIDEYMMGRGKVITVNIDSNKHIVECIDNGAGIPIGKLDDILCNLGTGGKFDNSSYEFSIGMNGMGTTIMNALSDIFECEVWRDGKHAIAKYSKGRKIANTEVVPNKENHPSGTRIMFRPDITVLYDITMNYDTYFNCFDLWCYVHPGMIIDFTFDNKRVRICHPEGLLGYMVNNIIKARKYRPLVKPIVLNGETSTVQEHEFEIPQPDGSIKKEKKSSEIRMEYEVYFTWCANVRSECIESVANGLKTYSGGTHETGFRGAVTDAIKKYINQNDLLPKNAKFDIDGSDIRESLVALVTVKHNQPLFSGQTKDELSNTDIQFWMKSDISKKLFAWLSNNKKEADNICKLIITNAKARNAAKLAKDNIIKASTGSLKLVDINPKKFAGCLSKNPDECELFICEGDSAFGSIKPSRNSRYQAAFAVRGKGQNVIDTNVTKLSDEHQMLTEILGCGIGPEFNINRLRYHKIILASDGDSDGSDIRRLLAGFFYKYFPEIVKRGYLYEALPPLFQITVGKGSKATTLYLPDQKSFNMTVAYAASEAFDVENLRTHKKLSKKLIKVYVQKLLGFKDMLEGISMHTGLSPELIEYIVRYYPDICKCKFKGLNALDYECSVLTKDDNHLHFSIDRNYEHYFCIIDNAFYNEVYLPVAKRLAEIKLMDCCFVGKVTGERYGGNCYRNSKFVDGLLINENTSVLRVKGLGESTTKDIYAYLLNPETRNLRQITFDEADKDHTDKIMSLCLGKDIDNRKQFCLNGTYNLK